MPLLRALLLHAALISSASAQTADDPPVDTQPVASGSWRAPRAAASPAPPPDDAEVARTSPGPECRRAIGGAAGMLAPSDTWNLVGSRVTGSPLVSLACNLGGKVRPFAALTTAPLQRHHYRGLAPAGLYVMPSFGIVTGRGTLRYGVYTVMMPRLIGIGASLELRFPGSGGGWLAHNQHGDRKGLELRFQALDGDIVQYQLQLLYTFGVTGS